MGSSSAKSVDEYLNSLPADRRRALTAVRDVINANLPKGYAEVMLWGMPTWVIPFERYPETYNQQPLTIAGLAARKGHMALYLMGVYGSASLEAWFRAAFAKAGKKLDMGKSCVRFTTLDALPLDVIGETIAKVGVDDFIAGYEASRAGTKPAKAAKTKPAAKAKTTKQPATKPKAAKKLAAKAKPATKATAKTKGGRVSSRPTSARKR